MDCQEHDKTEEKGNIQNKFTLTCLRRNVLAVFVFLGLFNMQSQRINFNIAIVGMTRHHDVFLQNGANITEQADFNWSTIERGNVLSSYYYGFMASEVIGGICGARYGGVTVFGTGIGISSLLTLVTPYMGYKWGLYGFIVSRIMIGIFSGMALPCVQAIWSRWAPPTEAAKLTTILYSAFSLSTLFLPFIGTIIQHYGWPMSFYIPGVLGVIWFMVFITSTRNDPVDDPRISMEELKYITDSIGKVDNKNIKIPWKAFFKSKAVWALIVCQFCNDWGYYVVNTQLPVFLNDVWNFNVEQAGFVSVLPGCTELFSLLAYPFLVEYTNPGNHTSPTKVRKLYFCIASLTQALLIYSSSFGALWFVILCFSLNMTMCAFCFSTLMTNPLDIAPQYASVLVGLSTTFGCLAGTVSTSISGYIIQTKSMEEWRIVFLITSGLCVFESVFYYVFGSGELQKWAQTSSDKNDELGNEHEMKKTHEK